MNILDTIVAAKKAEIIIRKEKSPISVLESADLYSRELKSLIGALSEKDSTGVIAEFKRRSPSKGVINDQVSVGSVCAGYENVGAAAISVLTDSEFFGGSAEDLIEARRAVGCPILRKDFVIDEYQIVEARAIGADAVLLIARILEPQKIQQLAQFAKSLGLSVLLEVHSQQELNDSLCDEVDVVGVNNRNLDTFEVSIELSKSLAGEIPDNFLKIAESGLSSVKEMWELRSVGFDGFLIGETFMKTDSPQDTCAALLRDFRERA